MIDRATIAKILDRADIVDVVSEFVTLKKAGANYKGLCPFHNDKTPSFSVSPARNYCHCFSCGKGGTPVGFIMEHEQMTYPEALRWLAKKYHIEIKEKELTTEEKENESERESMFIVNEFAARYYEDVLHNNPDGRAIGMQYFRSRGFRDDIIAKFRLGFALDERDAFSKEALAKGYKEKYLTRTEKLDAQGRQIYDEERRPVYVGTGLSLKNDNGQLIDKFRGRVMFPWITLSGKVVAFGGRKLDAATKGVQQKYVNSSDSIIYHKERELYGIYQAKKAIASNDRVFMVEGYTDVISMHQCGIENVVANSGTALSTHQIHMLHRLTKNIVLLYDGDAAGIHAALRGTDMLLSEGMNIKVLLLPDNDDPDSFARKHTAEEFRQYVESHQTDFIQFKTHILLNGVQDPVKRSEAISSIIKSVSVIPDPIIRAAYLQDCSARLRMPEQTLLTQMNRFISDGRKGTSTPPAGGDQGGSVPADPQPQDPQTPGSGGIANPPTPKSESHTRASERYLLEVILRHGEEILYDNVETEDNHTVSLTVAEYINYNLTADGLTFNDPRYTRILNECVERSHQPDFFAAPYFSQHPDIDISNLASNLLMERYTLSKSLEYRHTQESLQQHIEKLLLELRRDIVDSRLKSLFQQITACGNDLERAASLMAEFQELKKTSKLIADKLGKRI